MNKRTPDTKSGLSNRDEMIAELSEQCDREIEWCRENKPERTLFWMGKKDACEYLLEKAKSLQTGNTKQETIIEDAGSHREHGLTGEKQEYSDTYPCLSAPDFQDEIVVEVTYGLQSEKKDVMDAKGILWDLIKEYRIKLDGVRVIEYLYSDLSCYFGETEIIQRDEILGHDPGNKIIICEA